MSRKAAFRRRISVRSPATLQGNDQIRGRTVLTRRTDGSLHVTNGGFNPVLTIMALGYWVSDYIKKEWKGGRFRS